MSEINYKIANYDAFESYKQNMRKVSSFPSYFPKETFKELLPMDNLDNWAVTIGNEGDTVEVVSEIDTSLWSEDAKSRINPIIPNGKSSCIKMKAHSGTEISYLFDSPIDFTNETWGMYIFIDTESSIDVLNEIIEIRFHSSNIRDIYLFPVRVGNCCDNNWYLFSFHPTKNRTWNMPDLSEIHGIKILSKIPEGKETVIYISSIFRLQNNLTRGKILIDFDDNYLAFFSEAYRYMKGKYGYCGSVIVNGNKESSKYMNVNQLLRMQEDGWNVINHSWQHTNWRGVSYEEQEAAILKNIEWMNENGFWYGNQVYAATNYSLDYNMQHILKQHGFKFIRAGTLSHRGNYLSLPIINLPSCQPLFSNEISNNTTLEMWEAHLEDIQNSKALAVNVFHDISTTGSTSVEHFRLLIDEIQNYDIDVVTYADLLMDKVK